MIVTFGANQALFSAFQVTINPGDEILVPNPCFANYFGYIALAQGVAVPVPTYEKDHFHVKAEVLEQYITDKTRLLIINSPCNPTGSRNAEGGSDGHRGAGEETRSHRCLRRAVRAHSLRRPMNTGSIATLPGMFERTITANGFSKTYAMTGWRIGYGVADPETIKAMTLVLASTTSNVTAAVQIAALEALKGSQQCVADMNAEYWRRRDILVKGLNETKGISCITPEGAFYAFANIKELGMTSKEVAIKLLDEVAGRHHAGRCVRTCG